MEEGNDVRTVKIGLIHAVAVKNTMDIAQPVSNMYSQLILAQQSFVRSPMKPQFVTI
jgi:hypothetical protein